MTPKSRKGWIQASVLTGALLLLGFLPDYIGHPHFRVTTESRIRATRTMLSRIDQGIAMFHLQCGFYPSSLQDLLTQPKDRVCKGYTPGNYLGRRQKTIKADLWGNPLAYTSPGKLNIGSFDLWSYGPDGKDGTADDIRNSKGGTQ